MLSFFLTATTVNVHGPRVAGCEPAGSQFFLMAETSLHDDVVCFPDARFEVFAAVKVWSRGVLGYNAV
jgi:hypothetical protein